MNINNNILNVRQKVPAGCKLIAVSKTQPAEKIMEAYNAGQRLFGENKVQEILAKQPVLPADIEWHMIGHLQTNKVKYIAPFVYLIHGVDSLKLLKEINKQGIKSGRIINVLLQVHIAQEETKFGFDEKELEDLFSANSRELIELKSLRIQGLMGMASFTDNEKQVRNEFRYLRSLADKYSKLPIANCSLSILSMGMSADYKIAIEEGSNMVRIGSLIFGERA